MSIRAAESREDPHTRIDGVEQRIAFDMLRRSVPAIPVLLAVGWLAWGTGGAISTAYALALVLGNLALSAVLLTRAARVSLAFLMAVAVVGYPLRLATLFIAVWVARDQSWFEPLPLGLTIIVAHLGLLFWETRFVSLSLAYPGLKPGAGRF